VARSPQSIPDCPIVKRDSPDHPVREGGATHRVAPTCGDLPPTICRTSGSSPPRATASDCARRRRPTSDLRGPTRGPARGAAKNDGDYDSTTRLGDGLRRRGRAGPVQSTCENRKRARKAGGTYGTAGHHYPPPTPPVTSSPALEAASVTGITRPAHRPPITPGTTPAPAPARRAAAGRAPFP
jgi:hypothetical protein